MKYGFESGVVSLGAINVLCSLISYDRNAVSGLGHLEMNETAPVFFAIVP